MNRSAYAHATTLSLLLAFCAAPPNATAASPLFARGYAVIPYPQTVTLTDKDVEFGPAWHIDAPGVAANDIARAALIEGLTDRVRTQPGNTGAAVHLQLRPDSVQPGPSLDRDRAVIAAQAYSLKIHPGDVTIAANAPAGLFYGAETLVQLARRSGGKVWLPEGEIKDWPDLQIRNIYWDDAHHLDRPEALRRAIRQAAFFKINGFVIKLEGHFQFRHAPAVTEPYALSPAEFQGLTDYGRRYHVQLIPYLDGPAHIAFILKHPEYAPLRAFPDSNYELCATNPESYKLLEGMFQDLIDANRGVEYVYLSTDEPYYVGWADNKQCNEKDAANRYGSRGKLLAEFVTKTAGYLHGRGRKVVFWGEYPLKVGDISALPPYVINGEVYGPEFDAAFRKHGIRQMIYTSTQGEERIFPEYYPLPAGRRLHPAGDIRPRAEEVFDKVSLDRSRDIADLQGMVVAGWADAGQHSDDFWLGYATATAAGWRPSSPGGARELAASFYEQFYGPTAVQMDRAYQLLSDQAQFWADSWDTVESKSRKPIWGNSDRIYSPRRPAHDQSIALPAAPGDNLHHDNAWTQTNARRIELASQFLAENDELLGILNTNLLRAGRNRYTMEVLLSNAQLCRQNLEFLTALAHIDRLLTSASDDAAHDRPKQAAAAIDQALELARLMRNNRNTTLADVTETWYKTWFPRVGEANGRRFLHEVDDVKDHVPDRTVDMTYLILRQLQLPMDTWAKQVETARNAYAAAHKIPSRTFALDWTNTNLQLP